MTNDDDDNETMSGWDSTSDLDLDLLSNPEKGLGKQLLMALYAYLNYQHVKDRDGVNCRAAYQDLQETMSKIDWNALDFALNALAQGQDLFSCFSTNDVLTRYTPPASHDDVAF